MAGNSSPRQSNANSAQSTTVKFPDKIRSSRRTVDDAVEVLRSLPEFCASKRPIIRARPLRLSSGEVPSTVQLWCDKLGWVISLPTAQKFRAKHAYDGASWSAGAAFNGEIELLDGAAVDVDAHDECRVTLSDGTILRRVEIIPFPMPVHGKRKRDLQSLYLQDAVLHHVILLIRADDVCFRYIDQQSFPGVYGIDYSKLSGRGAQVKSAEGREERLRGS